MCCFKRHHHFFFSKFLASPAYPPVPHNMEQVWRSIASFSRHAYEHALILSTKHCVVHSFISLAGVHSKVRTRCSEVGTEWLKSWNFFLVFRNKNLWSRNSVLGLSQADKRKMRLVTSTVVLWCVAVYVVSATSAPTGKWKELRTTCFDNNVWEVV